MTDSETCPLCALEVDGCVCSLDATDVESARTSRLCSAELETLDDNRLALLERGRSSR